MARKATLDRQAGRLPTESTSLIGRDAELRRLTRLVGERRLITLTGPAGVGKTRLAVRAATLTQDAFDEGVLFVELSGLTEPPLLAQVVGDALGLVAGQGGESAVVRLAGRRLLLVLDNCDHLRDECAKLVEAMLRSAPGPRVLATSRQALDVAGEHTVAVAPLGCSAAVTLFAERAATAVQGWTLTRGNRDTATQLCNRLDGVPLAIELAAAQLRAFSLDQVLDRLGSTRCHQALRAAVDWSYGLCSAEERLLWARLSVFVDGFDLDAAHVCSSDRLPAELVADVLTGLVDRSIVQRADHGGDAEARYRMPATLREYGAQRLGALGGRDRLRHRCFVWYTGLLRRAHADLSSGAQVYWLEWFDCERGNIRALLGQVLATAERGTIRDAVEALGRFWVLRGALAEGSHWTDRVLQVRDTTAEGWTGVLATAALTLTLQYDLTRADELLDRAVEQGRAESDRDGVALAVSTQGIAALIAGDFDRALRLLGSADELSLDTGTDDLLFLLIDVFRGAAHLFKGEFAAAEQYADQAARASAERGELWVRSYGMLVCGLALWRDEDLDASLEQLRQSLRINRDLNDGPGMTLALEAIAACLASKGEFTRATRLQGATDNLGGFTRSRWSGPLHAWLRDIHIEQAAQALGEERFHTALAEGRRLPLADAVEDALHEAPPPEQPRAGVPRTTREP